jgi:hypothetical protein
MRLALGGIEKVVKCGFRTSFPEISKISVSCPMATTPVLTAIQAAACWITGETLFSNWKMHEVLRRYVNYFRKTKRLVIDIPKEKNRPIIFIGHSLGGILILQVRSTSAGHQQKESGAITSYRCIGTGASRRSHD